MDGRALRRLRHHARALAPPVVASVPTAAAAGAEEVYVLWSAALKEGEAASFVALAEGFNEQTSTQPGVLAADWTLAEDGLSINCKHTRHPHTTV